MEEHSVDCCIQDIEFASIMVQNLNNNLITAPELSGLRKRLRNLDSKVLIHRKANVDETNMSINTIATTLGGPNVLCGLV